MIIDCFTFNGEFDLLEGRLEYLNTSVDIFVIVESTITFSGISKQLKYPTQADRYQKYQHKILYFPVSINPVGLDFSKKINTFDPLSAPWTVERMQRNYISTALSLFRDNDIAIISDVDEIPSVDAIFLAVKALTKTNLVACNQQMFYYNFNFVQDTPWYGSMISKIQTVQDLTPEGVRSLRNTAPTVINGGGWHLSNWMSPEEISNKIKSFSHQEFNTPEFTDPDVIASNIKNGRDYLGRSLNTFSPFNRDSLPTEFKEAFFKFTKSSDELF